MATVWSKIIKRTALKLNALAGAQVAAAESAYASTSMTTTELDKAVYPPAAIKDACLDAQGLIALAIANTKDHPWRWYMNSSTAATVNSGAFVPPLAASGISFIGVMGPVYDSTDVNLRALTPGEYEDIMAYLKNSAYYGFNPYLYCFRNQQIFHTLASNKVKIAGCAYDRDSENTNLAANGNIMFPDACASLYVAGAVSLLMREGEYAAAAAAEGAFFQRGLEMITQGLVEFPQTTPAAPRSNPASR